MSRLVLSRHIEDGHGRGAGLKLPLMVQNNEEYMGTKFCVTVDGGPQSGVTTGVSAWDRATTIRALADPATQPTDLVRPGHIFPLRYTAGGVLVRGGHTEVRRRRRLCPRRCWLRSPYATAALPTRSWLRARGGPW
jgi:hypothetical protein